MLVAKIQPEAKFSIQSGPFSQPTTQTVPFMTASAIEYVPGAATSRFEVQFVLGNPDDVTKKIAGVRGVQSIGILLTAEELATWGTDDASLLYIVASKVGTNVVTVYTAIEGHKGQQNG